MPTVAKANQRKICTKCGMAFAPLSLHWRKDKTTPDGLTRQCKVCLLAKDRRARAAIKRDPVRRAHAAAVRETWMRRRARHFKHWQRAYMRQYKRDNPHVQQEYRARLKVKLRRSSKP